MGTEKKSKSGSELPKGSAAPSCNPRLCACPGRCYFRGAASKGVLSSPRAGRCLVGVTEVPSTPGATSPPASIGSGSCGGSCIKSWHPGAPFPAWQGRRGRQPGRDGGTQLALPCCCGGDHGSRGPPAEGWGGGQNPAGMGTPVGTSPRHGCWGLGGSGALWDGGCTYQGQAACGRLWVRVCCLCPGEDRSDFRGRLGGLTVPPHGCSPTDVTQGGSGQI